MIIGYKGIVKIVNNLVNNRDYWICIYLGGDYEFFCDKVYVVNFSIYWKNILECIFNF